MSGYGGVLAIFSTAPDKEDEEAVPHAETNAEAGLILHYDKQPLKALSK